MIHIKNYIKRLLELPIEFSSIKYFYTLEEAKLWHLTQIMHHDCKLVPTYKIAHSNSIVDNYECTEVISVQYYFRFSKFTDQIKYYQENGFKTYFPDKN